MGKRITAVLVITLAAVFFSTDVFAWGRYPEGSNGRGECRTGREEIIKKLNLTPEQDKALEAEKSFHRRDMADLTDAMRIKRLEIKRTLARPGVTRRDVEPIAAQIKKLEAEMTDRRIDGIFRVKEILTPEQFACLEEMREKRMQGGRHGAKDRMRYSEKRW